MQSRIELHIAPDAVIRPGDTIIIQVIEERWWILLFYNLCKIHVPLRRIPFIVVKHVNPCVIVVEPKRWW